jgi:small-conductance mechanosensitive channel
MLLAFRRSRAAFGRAHCWLLIALFTLLLSAAAPRAGAQSDSAEDDLSTPRRALSTFLDAANRNDWQRANQVLNVPRNASAARAARAKELAEQLDYVLTRNLALSLDDISDESAGRSEDGKDTERIASVDLRGRSIPLVLTHVQSPPERWVFSAGTLARIPELYQAHGPSPLEARMPAELQREALGLARWQWLGLLLAVGLSLAVGQLLVFAGHALGTRIAARTQVLWDDELFRELRAPSRLLITVLAFLPLAHVLDLPMTYRVICLRVAGTLGILAVAWIAIRVVALVSNMVERRALGPDHSSTFAPPAARGVQTQVRVLRRVVSVALAVCAGAFVLMQFETVRSIGVSLLASAGVAGVVLGIAAQRTLGSLLAGIQLSITQPIRIGDEVVVEGEFGTIEEITLTYIVVKVWDERRLIVPMNRFFDQPFQNWTKVSTRLHGTVMLYADFGLPVDALRAEVDRLITSDTRWDGRTKAVHVTDARERTLEVRVLVSAANGGSLFELRAAMRERLAAWLVEYEGGRYLPRTRVDDKDDGVTKPPAKAKDEQRSA